MWLKLDLEGLRFDLNIEDYIPNQTIDGKWASVSSKFEFQDIIKYTKDKSEDLMCYEIDELICHIEDLLNNKITEKQILEEIEPDLIFILNPKEKDIDINIEMKVNLWHGGLTYNYFSTTFIREDIEKLYLYLSLISHKIEKDDIRIKELIKEGILYGDLK